MPYDHKTKQLSQVLKSNTWLGNYLKSVRHVESRAAAARSCWSVTSKSLHPDVIKDPMHGSKRKPLNSISEEKRNSKTFLFLVSGRPTYQFNCTAIYRCNILLSTTSTHVRPFSGPFPCCASGFSQPSWLGYLSSKNQDGPKMRQCTKMTILWMLMMIMMLTWLRSLSSVKLASHL